MNAKIKELMIKSGAFDHYEINEGVDGDELPMVKFAELIVQVCTDIVDQEVPDRLSGRTINKIKQNFGVE